MNVLLLSGGLDSVTALYDLVEARAPTCALIVEYGQRHACELSCAKFHVHRLGVDHRELRIKLDYIARSPLLGNTPHLGGPQSDDLDKRIGASPNVVPNRNAVLISLAGTLADSLDTPPHRVVIATNLDDEEGFPDTRAAFMTHQGNALKEGTEDRVSLFPYWRDVPKRKWRGNSA